VYSAGRTDALERAAEAERKATEADIAAARADLRLEITRAFWALVSAIESEHVLARALDTIGAHVGDLRSRFDQGFIAPNEVLIAEAQQSRQRVLSIEATNLRGVSEADLRRLIGIDTPDRIEPVAVLEGTPAPSAGLEGLVGEARTQRAERRALEDRLNASRAREEAVVAEGRPQVGIAGGYDFMRPNPHIFPRADKWQDSWDASVNVSWLLWDGGRRGAQRAEAVAASQAVRARVADFDRQVTFEVQQRRLELESSRAAIDAAADGVRSAVEAQRVVTERFRAGVVTSTDVLDAEQAVLAAELDLTRSRVNARIAEARLARAVGK
jgi:outer membrane protein TolC